ncbi:MAG TPA: PD-(D/E)XK nuclease family protein, partial [Thermoanaerobaculia bacterium]|nr:PD-(D/E)XK nuclease family protein [Thermoanaerobaculia bacterium]
YKTGRPRATQKTEKGRRDELRRGIARGETLQAALYARAAGREGQGRYLYLRPDPKLEAARRELTVEEGDQELERLAAGAVHCLVAAWTHGDFFPRLTAPDKDKEPALCRSCKVSEACLRGDTTMRRQLFAWGQRALMKSPGSSSAADLWRLPIADKEPASLESTDTSYQQDD